mmetsp:Transcript_54957/g.119863  ORF Transcript_54957/g.119863 Transcript_54957/m.119863 type:complete len:257 (+) Transcript_54957:277-1047(+)
MDVVALVHGGDGDARGGHVRDEGRARHRRHTERVEPKGGARARSRGVEEGHAAHAAELLVKVGGVDAALLEDALDVAQIGEADGRVEVVHVELEAEFGNIWLHPEVSAARPALPVNAEPASQFGALVQRVRRGDEDPAVDGCQVLNRLQREDAHVAVRAERSAGVDGAHGVRAVLDHLRPEPILLEAAILNSRDRLQVDGRAAPVDDHDHLGRWRELALEVLDRHVARRLVDVDPLDAQPIREDWPVRRCARQRTR